MPDELDRARDERIFLLNEKLISKFVGNRLTFTFDNNQFYVLNSGCVTELINSEIGIKCLLGILNSKLLNFYFSNVFTDYRETFPIMKSGNVENLPIIVPSISIQNQITDLADDILNLKIMNSIENTIELEKQIDDLVYKLYNLTPEEIAIVEENTKK